MSRAEAAHAVHEIANAAMGSAVHVVTVQRGIDPRGFVLVAFGGAGPMHAARVAARFGIATVVVPAHCGVASAAGLLAGDLSVDRVRSALGADPAQVFAELTEAAAADLGVRPGDPGVSVERSADVRFTGQAHDLTVPWTDSPATWPPASPPGTSRCTASPSAARSRSSATASASPSPPPAARRRRSPPPRPRHGPFLRRRYGERERGGGGASGTARRTAYFAETGGMRRCRCSPGRPSGRPGVRRSWRTRSRRSWCRPGGGRCSRRTWR
nr:hypothetical protein GCM10020093_110230 [Planobispora longispora]